MLSSFFKDLSVWYRTLQHHCSTPVLALRIIQTLCVFLEFIYVPDSELQIPSLPSSVLSFALVCLDVNFFVSILLGNHGPSWNLNWNFHQSLLLQILPLSQSALSFLYETLLSNNVDFLALSPSQCATFSVCHLLGVSASWCVTFLIWHLPNVSLLYCVTLLCHVTVFILSFILYFLLPSMVFLGNFLSPVLQLMKSFFSHIQASF